VADDWTWTPPGRGAWYLSKEHFPVPVSRLYGQLFPPTILGWLDGARRFGSRRGESQFAEVNGWYYYSPGPEQPGDEATAAETFETKRWRAEVTRWHEVERPAVLAVNREMQGEDLGAMTDAEVVGFFERACAHFHSAGRLHFEHVGFEVAGGLLFLAAQEAGIAPARVATALAGASPGSAGAAVHVAAIAAGCTTPPASLADIQGPALDAYLEEYGVRVGGNDLLDTPLGERPGMIVASVRAALARDTAPPPDPVATFLAEVPTTERDRLAELLSDARASYGLRDDDVGVCYSWPLGLVRRAVLELARRAGLADQESLFETDPDEIVAFAAGHGPAPEELAARKERRLAAGRLEAPAMLGEPGPAPPVPARTPNVARLLACRDALWSRGSAPAPLHGTGVGRAAASGPAFVLDGSRGLDELEPGDVLVAVTTMPNHNVAFPIVAAVATAEGGLFSHAAILARELDIPAVVGVAGLLDQIGHGDLVEVDPVAGEVRVSRS
jgi:pyruvate,water dikinase